MKKVVIISGGTISHIATHLALCAPAYGATGRTLEMMCDQRWNLLNPGHRQRTADVELYETRMASGNYQTTPEGHETVADLETNEDVERLVDDLVADLDVKVIFMPVALCDFDVVEAETIVERDGGSWTGRKRHALGKGAKRLKTSENGRLSLGEYDAPDTPGEPSLRLALVPASKIISKIRQKRKDIFLVGFKTTDGVTEQEQYLAGLNLLKASSCNLVLANDVKTRVNMVITPEEAKYHVTKHRHEALRELVDMAFMRSHLTFTRSTVVAGEPVPWDSPLVPETLRTVVNHCIAAGAYKPFRGATVGHFACKLLTTVLCDACQGTGKRARGSSDAGPPPVDGYACRTCYGKKLSRKNHFLTSQRKTNFNDLPKLGLVRIETDGPDTVLAYGAKPSVGGQSQRIVFSEHPEYDCIVHFHCPIRTDALAGEKMGVFADNIPTVSQREYECGSHQCGQNTSRGLKKFGNLSCVMLDQHGPNIVFHHSIDPEEVIRFIDENFDLAAKTGGPV